MEGKKVTAYYACQPEVEIAGGQYQKVGLEDVVVDGNIVSGVAWTSHPKVMAEFIKLLGVKVE